MFTETLLGTRQHDPGVYETIAPGGQSQVCESRGVEPRDRSVRGPRLLAVGGFPF